MWNLQEDPQPSRDQRDSSITTEQTISLVGAALVIEDIGALDKSLEMFRADEISDLTKLVESAARNLEFGEEVMEVLLDRGGENIFVTEKLVELTAGNLMAGAKILPLLVNRNGG